jgi:hypothetical protein
MSKQPKPGKYQVLVMADDGETQTENPLFKTAQDAWDHAGNMGSRWVFYPVSFVIAGQTIKDAPDEFAQFIGKRIKTVSAYFNKHRPLKDF